MQTNYVVVSGINPQTTFMTSNKLTFSCRYHVFKTCSCLYHVFKPEPFLLLLLEQNWCQKTMEFPDKNNGVFTRWVI